MALFDGHNLELLRLLDALIDTQELAQEKTTKRFLQGIKLNLMHDVARRRKTNLFHHLKLLLLALLVFFIILFVSIKNRFSYAPIAEKLVNLFRSGQYLLSTALGGSFFGGLIANLEGSIIGAMGGFIFGLIKTSINNPNIWMQGKNVLASALGGSLIGGLLDGMPAAICGSILGAIFSIFMQVQSNS
ncbi:MAG: hypothetical protein QNJ63_03610 [Calothrix sp. MO_192.B10]|nr:hypothetical protein [Calothrix sp. MO_192.B10]